jgi:Protein of unknown function (DUF3455)
MRRRLFMGLAAAAALAGSLLITGVGSAATPDSAPDSATTTSADARGGGATPNAGLKDVRVDDKQFKIVATMRGVGAQVYTCGTDGKYALREPVATLSGRGGAAGIHGKGPFWASFDGSRVDGTPFKSQPSPDPRKNIPWLLVTGTPVKDAPGVFGNVAFIQRLDTRGGVAPATCSTPTLSVDYSANYVFWAKIGR